MLKVIVTQSVTCPFYLEYFLKKTFKQILIVRVKKIKNLKNYKMI